MRSWELLLTAFALAMDAFAVSICKGLASKESYIRTGFACGIWFGLFQALMPFLGWLLGSTISGYVQSFSAYIAFGLLAFLGIKMIVEAWRERGCSCSCCSEEERRNNASLAFTTMLAFAIATSIDALAAGLTFAAVGVNIAVAVLMIGLITFFLSFLGSAVGAKIGEKWRTGAEFLGGGILICIGIKILIEYLVSLHS